VELFWPVKGYQQKQKNKKYKTKNGKQTKSTSCNTRHRQDELDAMVNKAFTIKSKRQLSAHLSERISFWLHEVELSAMSLSYRGNISLAQI